MLAERPLRSDREALVLRESLRSFRIVPASSVGRSGGPLGSLRGGPESADSRIGMDSQSKGGHLLVLPFSPVRRELEALMLERNPQDQVRN